MDINFVKIHSCGRDYILLDGTKYSHLSPQDLYAAAQAILNRHIGVGGYGFITLNKENNLELIVQVLDKKGNVQYHDYDAIRCSVRYAFDSGIISKPKVTVHTGDVEYEVSVIDSINVTVKIGHALYMGSTTPITENPDIKITQGLNILGKNTAITPLFLGKNCIALILNSFADRLPETFREISTVMAQIRPLNVVFSLVYNREELRIRSFETHYNEVIASSTSSAAAMVNSVLQGFGERETVVHNRGGDIFIQWHAGQNTLFSTAPSEYSFTGNFYFQQTEDVKE